MLEVLFYTVKLFRIEKRLILMSAGRPKKDPTKRRDARIQVCITKTKKQWIKDCAKGQGMSMSRYIEKALHRKGGRWPDR
jgi:predicted HicB family RNase H-like nuclease